MASEAQQVKSAEKWINTIKLAGKEYKEFTLKGDKILKRYRDERSAAIAGEKKYNILWSNVQTIFPAIYSRKPKAQCDRRYKDKDPVGRCAAQILERALQFEIDHYGDYDSAIRNALKDRLLPGRGVAWVRYEPSYGQASLQITEDVSETDEEDTGEAEREITSENSPCDYVYWKDFRHSQARTWEEVTWIARRVYMDKDAGIKRFGEDFKKVPLSHEPIGDKDISIEMDKKAIVWEIWDKSKGKAIWAAENYPDILDEKDDPLELDCFFPIPKPLFATLTTDSLVPIADFLQYQDQAREIDELTDRIGKLVESIKVVGVYDSSQKGIERMMLEGVNNSMIPVDNWAAFGERGGLKGTVDWLPLDMVMQALNECYAAREQAKQVIYEITGLSDIIRGASKANETATAQQIKSNFASLRLKTIQNEVAVFASELLNIKAQIMCRAYQPETLIEMSGIMSTMDAEFVPQAIQLLKDNRLREFRVTVESDSLVELDERGEQEARTQFLAAVGSFMREAIQAPPELAPLMGEMLLFGVRGFKVGRDIENAFDTAMEQLKQPKPPAADPEAAKTQAAMQQQQQQMQHDQQLAQFKVQADQQAEMMKAQVAQQLQQGQLQADVQKHQAEMMQREKELQLEAQRDQLQSQHQAEIDQQKAQLDMQERQHEGELRAQLEQQKLDAADADRELEMWKARLDAEVKLTIAQISASNATDGTTTQVADSSAQALQAILEKLSRH